MVWTQRRDPRCCWARGGAARAIAAALLELGVEVAVANRSAARAEALAGALPGLRVLAWEDREAAVADCALLVNASSAGMAGGAALDMDLAAAGAGMVAADIVYVAAADGAAGAG